MSTRIEYGLDSDAYRDAPGLSHSESKNLRKSPFHFKQLSAPRDPELVKQPTPQMVLGTMVHCAVLEPHAFAERYVVGPEISKNSNQWKTFATECEQRGAQPISQREHDVVQAMAASVRALPDLAPLLDQSACEVSLWWNCPATGVLCKARPDLVKRYGPEVTVVGEGLPEERVRAMHERGFAILADIKTTDSADAESFARSVADYSYHTQAHWYCEAVEQVLGVPVLSFLFAVVEREFPYAAATYTLDDTAFRVAADINRAVRELYVQCKKAGDWPGYAQDTRDIALPPWYMKRFLQGLPV